MPTRKGFVLPYTILIVDDHPLVREGLSLLVNTLPGGATVHTAGTAAQALEQAEFYSPFDAVLLDCGLPDADGGALIQALSARSGGAPVVVVSGTESDQASERVLLLGAAAFVPKSRATSEVLAALKRVMSQGTPLSPQHKVESAQAHGPDSASTPALSLTARQLDVLLMLNQGLTNQTIALQLGLSEKTVKNHVTALFNGLGAANRLHAIRRARDLGLLT